MNEINNTVNPSNTNEVSNTSINSNSSYVAYGSSSENLNSSMSGTDDKNDGRIGNMPVNINKEVPSQHNDAQNITSLIKHSVEITVYVLDDGTRLSKEEGVTLAKAGGINGVAVGVSRKGEEYLRSLPDQNENNNLSSLPTINE